MRQQMSQGGGDGPELQANCDPGVQAEQQSSLPGSDLQYLPEPGQNRLDMSAHGSSPQAAGIEYERSCIQIPHPKCYERDSDVTVDICNPGSSLLPTGTFLPLQGGSLDHLSGRALQYCLRHSQLSVLVGLFRLHGGYLIVKLLLCIFFVFLGIISLRTLAVQDRRDAVIVCSRLVHAAALTHKNQDEFKQLDLSLENLKTVGKPFLLIIAYVFIYILFFGICIWEGLAVWSVGHISFIPHQLFLSVSGFASSFLFVLLLIQLVWGAFFIK